MEALPQETPQAWTTDQRKTVLSKKVQEFTKGGWRVESQADFSATLVKGRRPNHILHLILSILTAGLWLIVWAIVAITGGEKRRAMSVDEYGRITG
jgi:hypothetical protein